MRVFATFVFLIAAVPAGCSSKQVYTSMQEQARSQCVKTATQQEYADCVERASNMSYEEYEQKRAEKEQNP
jgi:hypothetical protein